MKKLLFTTLIFLSLAFVGFSQTIPPPYINYQAVLYDVNGANPNTPLTNQSFTTFVNINDELGNLLYREEHYASTDANGLITIRIGDGIYIAGTIINFNQINWSVGKYYLVIDFDINGTISSTAPEQLVSVPYSFYAGNAGNGMTAVADNGNGTLTFTYANGQTYITPALSGIQGAVGPAGPPGTSGSAGPQGAPGPQGQAGVNGTNGLNALIKTTTEPVGANCANGGTKIETGSDANGNGVLDAGEVNAGLTKYVCDGIGSGISFIPSQGVKLGFALSSSWTCPSGVNQIQVELWGAGGGAGGRAAFRCGNTSGGSCVGLCASPLGGFKGGDGGKGGYVKQVISVTPGQVYNVTIGQGGNAGNQGPDATSTYCTNNHPLCNGANGTIGGSSSFHGIVIANGGTGGIGGQMSYMSGTSVFLYASCSVPNGIGLNGIDASVLNYSYPPQTSGTRTYLPTGYVTNYPSSFAPGGISFGITNPYTTIPAAATAGENGFCLITY